MELNKMARFILFLSFTQHNDFAEVVKWPNPTFLKNKRMTPTGRQKLHCEPTHKISTRLTSKDMVLTTPYLLDISQEMTIPTILST